MIIAKCRKGGKPGEKIVTVPTHCNIEPGEFLFMKRVEVDHFDDIFKEVKDGKRK